MLRLADLRRRRHLSQAELAERVGVAPETYARWERGTQSLRPRNVRALADALGVDPVELVECDQGHAAEVSSPARAPGGGIRTVPVMGDEWTREQADVLAGAATPDDDAEITAETAPRVVHEWLVTPSPQVVELKAGRRIGANLVEQIARRVERLRRLDDLVAGADLTGPVDRELRATGALVNGATYDDRTGRRLLAVLGDLCQLAGWAAADAGHPHRACHHYATGMAAAHAADDRPLAGQLGSTLAYHLSNEGRQRDAVLLAQSAVSGSRDAASATTVALFLDRLAWTCARSGDAARTASALDAVETVYAGRDPDADPPWTYWLDRAEIDIMAGRCWVELGHAELAVPPLERALATGAYGADRPREAALYVSWLAEAYFQLGEVDHAAELANDVLDLTTRTASVRSDDRARHLHQLLHPHAGVAGVDDFTDRYQTLAT